MARNPIVNLTRNQIVKAALGRIRAIPVGQAVPAQELTDTVLELNLLTASMINNNGLRLWLKRAVTLFTEVGSYQYNLGSLAGDADWAFEPTQGSLSAAEASGQTQLSVTSSTGMTAVDKIGIILSDNTMQWTTIASVDSSVLITVDDALTGAASSGAKIYWYTSKVERPAQIIRAYRRDQDNIDTEINVFSEEEYSAIPNKRQKGTINALYYDPRLTSGKVSIWNPPDNSKTRIICVSRMPFKGFEVATDTAEFPEEYQLALVDGLAARMVPYYGNMKDLKAYQNIAETSLNQAEDFDREEASTFMSVDNEIWE